VGSIKVGGGKLVIIVRTPLRVSLFGGGTDIEPYMTRYGGKVLSFTIDKYIYQSAHPLVESNDILLKYSNHEKVSNADEIQHRVFREVLKKYSLQSIDIAVSSDIAAGTGLGSSSAFTVGLLHLVEGYLGFEPSKRSLAALACEYELDFLKEPIGIQDQYASAFGGINVFNFNSRNDVDVNSVYPEEMMLKILKEHVLLFRVPGQRSASNLLRQQISNMEDSRSVEILNLMKSVVEEGLDAWKKSDATLGRLLNYTWRLKSQLSPDISNGYVDQLYDQLLKQGFYGGKLLGAGGSGYLLMVGDPEAVDRFDLSKDFSTIRVYLDQDGSKVIYNSEHD